MHSASGVIFYNLENMAIEYILVLSLTFKYFIKIRAQCHSDLDPDDR